MEKFKEHQEILHKLEKLNKCLEFDSLSDSEKKIVQDGIADEEKKLCKYEF